MLNWCNRFNICCFLDNHNYNLSHHTIECLAAAGSRYHISCSSGEAFARLQSFSEEHHDWLFGHLSYDLKNEIENLESNHHDHVGFPDLFFFVPEVVLRLAGDFIEIGSVNDDHNEIWLQIQQSETNNSSKSEIPVVRSRYTREQYISTVQRLQQHILRGDCYELNLCQEFYADECTIDPVRLFNIISRDSPNPFSGYYKINDRFLLCFSPERFLKRDGSKILSQPIKGTSPRDNRNAEADRVNAAFLATSEKERAENVMVVDLVRNDLSRVCRQGSVMVEELCAIYSFPQVHQMISTVIGELREDVAWTNILKAAFPMGSMTGAPKPRVMQLLETYELSRRGLFSGSLGYVTPDRDFDFNVVIRSLLYNRESHYLSFHTGSAITFNSVPEQEYEECLLKAGAIKKALAETNTFH